MKGSGKCFCILYSAFFHYKLPFRVERCYCWSYFRRALHFFANFIFFQGDVFDCISLVVTIVLIGWKFARIWNTWMRNVNLLLLKNPTIPKKSSSPISISFLAKIPIRWSPCTLKIFAWQFGCILWFAKRILLPWKWINVNYQVDVELDRLLVIELKFNLCLQSSCLQSSDLSLNKTVQSS